MCPRPWPIEEICIGLYVLKRLLNEKRYVNATEFRKDFRKTKKSGIEVCMKFGAKTVLVESANQFSLKEISRTQ